MPFTLVRHPLLEDRLTALRDARTGPAEFRACLRDIATVLAVLALRDLPTEPVTVTTPLARARGGRLDSSHLVLVPVLRAGLGMVEAVHTLFPEAAVCHLGVYRDEDSRLPVPYYAKLPLTIRGKLALMLDPMLATGGSAAFSARLLRDAQVQEVRLLSVVAAPDGVRRMAEDAPEVAIYAAALDPVLNKDAFIVPGLGDAGDRQFDTLG